MTTKKSGVGLGLSIVRETVRLLQGSIDIQSQIGKGTTVQITLPHLMPAISSI